MFFKKIVLFSSLTYCVFASDSAPRSPEKLKSDLAALLSSSSDKTKGQQQTIAMDAYSTFPKLVKSFLFESVLTFGSFFPISDKEFNRPSAALLLLNKFIENSSTYPLSRKEQKKVIKTLVNFSKSFLPTYSDKYAFFLTKVLDALLSTKNPYYEQIAINSYRKNILLPGSKFYLKNKAYRCLFNHASSQLDLDYIFNSMKESIADESISLNDLCEMLSLIKDNDHHYIERSRNNLLSDFMHRFSQSLPNLIKIPRAVTSFNIYEESELSVIFNLLKETPLIEETHPGIFNVCQLIALTETTQEKMLEAMLNVKNHRFVEFSLHRLSVLFTQGKSADKIMSALILANALLSDEDPITMDPEVTDIKSIEQFLENCLRSDKTSSQLKKKIIFELPVRLSFNGLINNCLNDLIHSYCQQTFLKALEAFFKRNNTIRPYISFINDKLEDVLPNQLADYRACGIFFERTPYTFTAEDVLTISKLALYSNDVKKEEKIKIIDTLIKFILRRETLSEFGPKAFLIITEQDLYPIYRERIHEYIDNSFVHLSHEQKHDYIKVLSSLSSEEDLDLLNKLMSQVTAGFCLPKIKSVMLKPLEDLSSVPMDFFEIFKTIFEKISTDSTHPFYFDYSMLESLIEGQEQITQEKVKNRVNGFLNFLLKKDCDESFEFPMYEEQQAQLLNNLKHILSAIIDSFENDKHADGLAMWSMLLQGILNCQTAQAEAINSIVQMFFAKQDHLTSDLESKIAQYVIVPAAHKAFIRAFSTSDVHNLSKAKMALSNKLGISHFLEGFEEKIDPIKEYEQNSYVFDFFTEFTLSSLLKEARSNIKPSEYISLLLESYTLKGEERLTRLKMLNHLSQEYPISVSEIAQYLVNKGLAFADYGISDDYTTISDFGIQKLLCLLGFLNSTD